MARNSYRLPRLIEEVQDIGEVEEEEDEEERCTKRCTCDGGDARCTCDGGDAPRQVLSSPQVQRESVTLDEEDPDQGLQLGL